MTGRSDIESALRAQDAAVEKARAYLAEGVAAERRAARARRDQWRLLWAQVAILCAAAAFAWWWGV